MERSQKADRARSKVTGGIESGITIFCGGRRGTRALIDNGMYEYLMLIVTIVIAIITV